MNPFESGAYAKPRPGSEQKSGSGEQVPKQENPLGITVEQAEDFSKVLKGVVGTFDAFVGGLKQYEKKGKGSWSETALILLGAGKAAWPHLKEGAEALERLLEEQQKDQQGSGTRGTRREAA